MRWNKTAQDQSATTWKTLWKESPLGLYDGLKKYQATALILLRTEIIRLDAWLVQARAPNILSRCICGWHTQTVKHIMILCPAFRAQRENLMLETHIEDFQRLLSYKECARMTARWFARSGFLEQFRLANELEQESTELFLV